MFPSLRFVALFAAGVLVSVVVGTVLVTALVLALLLSDFFLSQKHTFTAQRAFDRILSIGVENPIFLHVRNRSGSTLSLKLRDEYPQMCAATPATLTGKVPPYAEADFRYSVTPYRRGEYQFGNLFVRRASVLGLWVFEHTFDLKTPARVYPNVQMVKKYDILSRRQMLHFLGVKPTKIYGQGTEFEMLRDYQVDDEYRAIDWKATSKKGKPISRVYQVERTKNVLIMMDAGRIMGMHTGDLTKLEYAANSALLVSSVALKLGERVGLCIFSSEIKEYIPLQGKRSHFNVILEALYNLKADSYESDYKNAFEYISRMNRKRSLVVVYTDLVEKYISQQLIQYCSTLQKTHLPLCVAVRDVGITRLAESHPETERELYQKAVALHLLKEREIAIKELTKRGVRVVDELPEHLTISTLNKYLELKNTMRM